MTMTDLCAEIRNYFDLKRAFGTYTISNGTIIIDDMQEGQYFRICGSVFNDGVYQYPAENLVNETFDGAIWYMAIPPNIVDLVSQMTEWETSNQTAISSPYSSESFGGYSYTRATGGSGADGGDGSPNAFSHFASQLKPYRKARAV